MIRSWLAHPLTRGIDIDDPKAVEARRRIIEAKRFLRKIYEEWYRAIAASLPQGPGGLVELGSGGGFLRDFIPGLITSECFPCPGVDCVLDGRQLPFGGGTLRGIAMTNVFHHIPQPAAFLEEATRCLRPGGGVVMIEPWVTPWSCFVYRRLHHEPFDAEAQEWGFPASGPLSGANGALPWIVLIRDRARFDREFPRLRVESIRPFMPFRYLLSGGVGLRALVPGSAHGFCGLLEGALRPWMRHVAMFAHIVIRRV